MNKSMQNNFEMKTSENTSKTFEYEILSKMQIYIYIYVYLFIYRYLYIYVCLFLKNIKTSI